jgi:hypothetical protein
MRTAKPKPPKITYRQEDGDDGYCYCVRVDGRAVTYASLTRNEAMHHKNRLLGERQAKQGATK